MSGDGVFWVLLRRTALRHWRASPGQTLLLVAILSLGVAVYVAVRLANRAAVASFTHFTDTLTGQSDWIVRAPAGALPEATLRELRDALGSRPVHLFGVLEASAATAADAERTSGYGRRGYTLLGIDLVAIANLVGQRRSAASFFTEASTDGRTRSFWETLDNGPQVWVPRSSPGATLPEALTLVVDERVVTLPVAGAIPHVPETPLPPDNLLVLDLPQLQQLLGRSGQLDRVELVIEPGPREAERRAEVGEILRSLAGERWLVTTPGARRESAATMTQAFRLNLTVLSLIALLVGLYLVFQALDGAVVRRRAEIAILRSLGVEPRTIHRLWLMESAALGAIGGSLGVLLGWLGAQSAVRSVGQTVNALYFSTTVQAAAPTSSEALGGIALGIMASVIAGWWPARATARIAPAHVLHRSAAPSAGAAVWRSGWLAGGLIVAGIALAWAPPWPLASGGRFPVAGYAAAFCWIAGGGILAGLTLPLASRLFRSSPAGAASAVARGYLRFPSGRHRLAVAALHCAVGMTAGMIVLVGSFDRTLRGWVARSLQADLYVSSDAAQGASARARISAAAADELAAHPAVAATRRLVAYPIIYDNQETTLSGVDLSAVPRLVDLAWVAAPVSDAVFEANRNTALALVSEAFAERFHRRVGDELRLLTPIGPREVRVAGIFADYGNERGSILVERSTVHAWFQEDAVTNVALWLRPGADAEVVRTELLRRYPGLAVFTNARLRTEILRIFRQTFAITYALEIIGVIVAVVGLALTLTSVLLDRRDELTTLRALGFARGEIARATALEGGVVAITSAVAGLGLSLALGWLLIYVINKQSFGWTLGFAVPWPMLGALAAAVVGSGIVVSYVVGRWGARLPADREEE